MEKSGTSKILSIHYGHNATVGLSMNGEIKCLVNEERIIRMKNATGFPYRALEYVKKTYLNDDLESLDMVVLNNEPAGINYLLLEGFKPHKYSDYYCNSRKTDLEKINTFFSRKAIVQLIQKSIKALRIVFLSRDFLIERIAKEIGIRKEKLAFLNHHKSHAYSALYFTDSAKEKLIFTLDGTGDGLCATVNKWNGKELSALSTNSDRYSLGYIYSGVTAYLGMRPDEHEFKVMGLAPYADNQQVERIKKIFENLLWLDKEGKFDSNFSMLSFKLSDYLIRNLIYERFDNISGALQKFTEELICNWVSHWVNKTGIKEIAVSGGVFMNVKASKKVAELPEVDKITAVPSAGDESLVLGGCCWGNLRTGNPITKLNDLYLGREFSDESILAFLETVDISNRYHYTKLDHASMARKVAALLAGNEIVARCYGREEWGARALGNRSILCNPKNSENINILNQQIKMRDFWMPFTPSILEEDIDQYIINPKKTDASFMSVTFDSTEKARIEIPAAMHPHDHTIRAQSVSKEKNPEYHAILKEFKSLTNISGLVNTSFNLHGAPNVSSPEDALYTLDHSGLKYLILGNYFVEKK